MAKTTDAKLFQYYERQELLPTFGNLRSPAELADYAARRRELFADKLMLPPRLFRGAEVLEFGPDSGENAMVFAGWGARMTLVEPHQQAHLRILAYFNRFGLIDSLVKLVASDVEGFRSDRCFDVIDAEGFIYTLPQTEAWLRAFCQLLNPDGYAIVSYYERYGGFFELALKAVHAAGRILTGLPALESAKFLFETKWNSIPHTRSFESWLMDVLENPFVRYRYFIDAATLCRQAEAAGLGIHAAWPCYRDTLDIYWHKKCCTNQEKLQRTLEHLRRSRLSFVSGQKLYLVGEAEAVDMISASLERLTRNVDALIDDPLGSSLMSTISTLTDLQEAVRSAAVLADDETGCIKFADTLASYLQIFGAIARQDADELAALTRSNASFINTWGMPAHFMVLRKRVGAPGEAL